MQQLLRRLSDSNIKLDVNENGQLLVNAPAGVVTAELGALIRKHKAALIDLLKKSGAAKAQQDLPRIKPDITKRYDPFPLNAVQHAYWIGRNQHIELGGRSTHFYFEAEAGDIDISRLEAALNKVVRSHDMLRATIDVEGMQRASPQVPDYRIRTLDLRDLHEEAAERVLTGVRAEMAHQVFDCTLWPLFEVRAARLRDDRSLLFFSWDFLVVDAWSILTIYNQWRAFYDDPTLVPQTTSISFRDYLLAEKQLTATSQYAQAKSYWLERVDELPLAPVLPVKGRAEPGRKYEFTRRRMRLPAEAWSRLAKTAQAQAITPSNLLLAAFSEVLNRWSKTRHYSLNLTLFNRLPMHDEVMALVGDFTTLAVTEIGRETHDNFADRAKAIQNRFLEDFAHRHFSGVEVLREIAKRRQLGGRAIMPVVFTSTLMLAKKGTDESANRGLEQFGPMRYGITQTPQVLLDCQIFEIGGELVVNWDAVEDMFLPGVLDAMFDGLQRLIETLADDPGAWTRDHLVELPPDQQRIRERNHESLPAAPSLEDSELLHTAFLHRAMTRPEALAIVNDDMSMTYGELLALSCELAERLSSNGVGRNELVAVAMEKGWQQIAAVLGILIAGAAYLPIDPGLPVKRQNYLVTHGDLKWVLVSEGVPDAVLAGTPARIIEVVRRPEWRLPAQLPQQRQSQQDIAYVIFTSGSSGTPKGVIIDHRGALNTIVAMNSMFDVGCEDRVLAVSSLSFDLSVYDIFGPLAVGGCIVMPPKAAAKDAACWSKLIAHHRVTIWNSAPQLMGMLVDYNDLQPLHDLSSIRTAWMSGDWIPTRLPSRIRALVGPCQVVSLGGATEGSIWSIYHVIEGDTSGLDSIPYGKSLPGQTMQVLDDALEPCPDHVVGNIYIGGLGVALGYWKDQEKTSHRFIVHPRTGERLYLTGDLGRYFGDGVIEFLGREDEQVKLHGHRVELGEIAVQLKAFPHVEDAAVYVADAEEGHALVACIVPVVGTGSPLYETVVVDYDHDRIAKERLSALTDLVPDAKQAEDLGYFGNFWSEMSTLCMIVMHATVRALGLEGETDVHQALARAGVLERYHFLPEKWLQLLQQANSIEIDARGRAVSNGNGVDDPEDAIVRFEAQYSRDPRTSGFSRYIAACMRHQLALLKGETSPLELLFPHGDFELAANIYRGNPVSAYHNRQLASVFDAVIAGASSGQPLRILEVGAGTGATTESLLPLLDPAASEYWFTDLSPLFLERARQKFAAYDFLHYDLFNIDNDHQNREYPHHGFDVIVAANVLHDAKHVTAAVERLGRLLKAGGHMILLEGTEDSIWQWLTVSYLEGVGSYQDERASTRSPILSVSRWAEVLQSAGFDLIGSYPHPRGDDDPVARCLREAMPQHVMVAKGPERVSGFNPQPLREHLEALLPGYMVPQYFIEMTRLPLSTNGKVDRSALPRFQRSSQVHRHVVIAAEGGTEEIIHSIWKEVLNLEFISVEDNFFDIGGDSLLLTQTLGKLNRAMGATLSMADLFSYPTIRSLSEHIAHADQPLVALRSAEDRVADRAHIAGDIAIIGMAGRFPDAPDIDAFWTNLRDGRCSVRQWDDETLRATGVDESMLADPSYVKAGVRIDGLDLFDADYFGFPPGEAQIMDPQLRFLLEEAVTAMEHAGYPHQKHCDGIGVFVGKDVSQYLYAHLFGRPGLMQRMGVMAIANVNEKDYAATQVSYNLGFTGPSLNINTACSTSLVAIHQACQSLHARECGIALAGGVSLETVQPAGYLYRQGSIASPDGYCRAFSDDANGCVRGSGIGLVVLKPLERALADRDTVHAVIKGSAINNDGANKIGFTAPSMHGQARVIAAALEKAGLSASDIQYVEAHGTGTELGDPIEIKGLAQVFRARDNARCAIGSVKTNFGHLDAAAGAAGLIKAVLAMKHGQIPASLHFRAPSPRIDFGDGALYVNDRLNDWPDRGAPRRAGVSSFGVGGTNAHVVLEQAPVLPVRTRPRTPGPQTIVLSARNARALENMTRRFAEWLDVNDSADLEDVAYTLQVGRNAHRCRRALVCDSISSLRKALREEPRIVVSDMEFTPAVVFVFPGDERLHPEATRTLHRDHAVFRQSLDRCAELIEIYQGADIRSFLYPAAAAGDTSPHQWPDWPEDLLPAARFALQYSLAQLWLSFGIRPEAMIGRDQGEYVAACLSGVFSLEEALSLVVVRSQLIASLEPGGMLMAEADEAVLSPLIEASGCSLAMVETPMRCVASGEPAAIRTLQARLDERGIPHVAIATERAAQSSMMTSIVDTFAACVREVRRGATGIPFISGLSGRLISDAEAVDPDYWARHLSRPLRFADGLRTLSERKHRVYLTVGLTGGLVDVICTNGLERERVVATLTSDDRSAGEPFALCRAVGQLWLNGIDIDWPAVGSDHQAGRIPLPTYAFDRQSYWLAPTNPNHGTPIDIADSQGDDHAHRTRNEEDRPQRFPRPEMKIAYAEPVGEAQVALVELWQSFLSIEPVGVDDNFFELGGDSLLGVQINDRMKHDIGIDIPVDKLFLLGSIRNISNYHAILCGEKTVSDLSDMEVDAIYQVYENA